MVSGGLIHIEVPNFMWQTMAMSLDKPDPSGKRYTHKEIVDLIFGGQEYEGNYHKTGFTEETLRESLVAAGFGLVSIRDIGQVLIADAVNV